MVIKVMKAKALASDSSTLGVPSTAARGAVTVTE